MKKQFKEFLDEGVDAKKNMKEAMEHLGMTKKEVQAIWDKEKPHFGGSAPHRYEKGECVYCLRPKNYK